MIDYTFYDPETGRILSSGSGVEMPDWAPCVAGIHMPDMYVDVVKKVVVPRPENPTTLEGLTLKNVPENSTIVIDADVYETPEGGTVELNFNLPGTYIVLVESFPFLDKEFTIDYQP